MSIINNNEQRWEEFLATLRGRPEVCDLSDNSEHGITYDDVNVVTLRNYRRRIVRNLTQHNTHLPWVILGNQFLSLATTELEQRQLYDAILNCDGLDEICFGGVRQIDSSCCEKQQQRSTALNANLVPTLPILEALLSTRHRLQLIELNLQMSRIAGTVEIQLLAMAMVALKIRDTCEVGTIEFDDSSQVQLFATILGEGLSAKFMQLSNLNFTGIICPQNASDAFLDPLIEAVARTKSFEWVPLGRHRQQKG